MTVEDCDLFEIIDTTRSMRRLKTDPVPDALIERIVSAGTKAPSGQNTQPWAFLVVRDPAAKRWLQERYLAVMQRAMGDRRPSTEDRSPGARTMRAALYLAHHLHEAPVLLLGLRRAGLAVRSRGRGPQGPRPAFLRLHLPSRSEHPARLPCAWTRRHADHPASDVRGRTVWALRYSGHPRRGSADPDRLSARPIRSGAAETATGGHAPRSLGQPVAGLTLVELLASVPGPSLAGLAQRRAA